MAVVFDILVFVIVAAIGACVVYLMIKLKKDEAVLAGVGSKVDENLKQTNASIMNVGSALGSAIQQTGSTLNQKVDELDTRALSVAQASSVGVAQVPKAIDGKVSDLKVQVSAQAVSQSNALAQNIQATAADIDRRLKTQVSTGAVRIADNWMFVPGSSNDLYLTDDRSKGLGNLVVETGKAGTLSSKNLKVTGLASFPGGKSTLNPKGLATTLGSKDGKNYIRGDTAVQGKASLAGDVSADQNMNVSGRLHFGDKSMSTAGNAQNGTDSIYMQKVKVGSGHELRLTVNDDDDKAFAIYGGSCRLRNCAGPGEQVHRFDAAGDAIHKGTVRAGKTPADKTPPGWAGGVHTKAVYADAVSVGTAGQVTTSLASDRVQAPKLQLGNKWLLSGVGDKHGNDNWLRVFNAAGTDYNGGVAMNDLWVGKTAYLNGDVNVSGKLPVKGDIIANGKICMGTTCMTAQQFTKLANM